MSVHSVVEGAAISIHDAIVQRTEHLDAIRKLRKEAAAEIDRLLAFLDQTGGDPDLEPDVDAEIDRDGEPSLGSINPTISSCQEKWSAGGADDCEDEHCGREPDHDNEADPAEAGIADHEGLYEQMAAAFAAGTMYWGAYV